MYRPTLWVQTAIICSPDVTLPAASNSSSSSSSTGQQEHSGAETGFASDWSTREVLMLALLDTAVLVAFCLGICLLARHLRKTLPAHDPYKQLEAVLLAGVDTEQTGSSSHDQQQQLQLQMSSGRISGTPEPGFPPEFGGAQAQLVS